MFSFNGTQNSTRVLLDKPLYVVHDTDSGPVIAMKCGLFAIGRNVTEWGGRTRHPCPARHDLSGQPFYRVAVLE
ncbi:hypothetical protein ACRAWF_04105 [Streptomyces sp. L7]